MQRSSFRIAMAAVVVVLGLVQVQSLLQALRSEKRLKDRVVSAARQAFVSQRDAIASLLAPGGASAWHAALERAVASGAATEAELFDVEGRARLSVPQAAPVLHFLTPENRSTLRGSDCLVVGPISSPDPRVLVYAPMASGGENLILRLAVAAPDLVEALKERRELFLGHGLAALCLILALGLSVLPTRAVPPPPHPHLEDAYAAAMERLREHGEVLSKEHAEDRSRMEEALREKDALARAGELTAGIVHEVRNGLGTVLGYARLLERGEGSVPSAAQSIREECETLEVVIRRFMDFVKMEALNRSPLDVRRLLIRVAARESRGHSVRDVRIQSGESVSLIGDEELLERVFENLVRNACEASGPKGDVEIAVEESEAQVSVRIADQGPGLTPKQRQELRPFFSTKPGGLGLGLAIARKIVGLHGGEISLLERAPSGLEVLVRLPRENAGSP